MTLLYYDPQFLDHDTGVHPERPLRLQKIIARLDAVGVAEKCTRPMWPLPSRERLERVHGAGHIDRIVRVAANGGGHLDPDTVVSPASAHVAQLAAGAACDAVDRVVAGEDKTALCLVRPPGHH